MWTTDKQWFIDEEKRNIFLQRFSKINHMAFDKTGTLTYGKPEVVGIKSFYKPRGRLSLKPSGTGQKRRQPGEPSLRLFQ